MAERTEKLVSLIVPADQAGERVDVYLQAALPDVSRSQIQSLLKQGFLTVGGRQVKPSERLQGEELVTGKVPLLRTEGTLTGVSMDLDIVYEDDAVVVVNKPAGITVHPGAGTTEPTLVHGLIHRYQNLPGADPIRPGIVHRLDKMTSGLLVCAKTHHAMAHLSEQFRLKTAHRRYLALVDGVPEWQRLSLDNVLIRDPHNRLRFCVRPEQQHHPEGKRAVTHLQCQAQFGHRLSLIAATLDTGRTHQIRVHLSHLGLGILGDLLYHRKVALPLHFVESLRDLIWGLDGQLLHAVSLSFEQPQTGERLQFAAALPEKMAAVLQALEPYKIP